MPAMENPRHEAFAQAYARTGNASEAFRATEPEAEAAENANVNGHKWLINRHIQARVAELRIVMAAECDMTRQEAVDILVRIIRSAPDEAAMDNPLCDLKMSKAGPFACFPDKLRALERLSKMVGWEAPEKKEISGTLTIEGVIADIVKGDDAREPT